MFAVISKLCLIISRQPEGLRAHASPRYLAVSQRYGNLFHAGNLIAGANGAFIEPRLIHQTVQSAPFRSISKVVAGVVPYLQDTDYQYSEELRGKDGVERYSDFTDEDPTTGIMVYGEHLGMLSNTAYMHRWKTKPAWRKVPRLEPTKPQEDKCERMVTSEDGRDGGTDSTRFEAKVRDVFEL